MIEDNIPTRLEIAQETIKKMLKCEREYRCEVSDPELRFHKLAALWEHERFITEIADPVDMASVIRQIINYQIMQIYSSMIAQKHVSGNCSGDIKNQQLTVLNAIFEIICRLSRSAQQKTQENASLDEECEKRLKEVMKSMKRD